MNIIDRRLNPGGKSFANRQRFLRRARAQVRRAVREASSSRSIKDAGKGGEITIPAGGVHEPHLRRSSQGGVRDYVLPGNNYHVYDYALFWGAVRRDAERRLAAWRR